MEKKPSKSSNPKKSLNSKVSFKVCQNRVAGIKKKAMELALLCDIPVCVVIMEPSGEVHTWPENRTDVQSVLDKYSEKERVRSAENRERPLKKSTSGETNDHVELVRILDSKLEAIANKIMERMDKNGATAINVAEIDNPDTIVGVFDFDKYEIENAAEYLDAIDFLDQKETGNPGKLLDFVDVDLDNDEKASALIDLPHQEEILRKRRSLGSGFSDWEEFSTDFNDWVQLCTDWEKFSGDFGEEAEVSTDFEDRRQIPIDSDSDKLPQLQNSDPIGSSFESPLLAGCEFPQPPLETIDIAMDISMTELLQYGEFLSGDVGNSDFSTPLMAGF